MGLGEFYSITCAVIWALAVVLFKRSGESLAPNDLNLFKNVLTFCLLLPIVLFIEGWVPQTISGWQWSILLVSGVIGIGLADSFYFKALNTLGASRMGIVASLYSPFVILLSVLFLGEFLVLWQYLGFVLVLSGVLLVSYRRRRQQLDEQHVRIGVIFGALAVFLNAAGVVMVKPVLEQVPFLWAVWVRILAGALALLVMLRLRGRLRGLGQRLRAHHAWPNTVIASLLGGMISMMLWLAGYKYTDASTASVLNETASVFIVLFAWLILHEELNRRKIAGVMLTFCGVILMIRF